LQEEQVKELVLIVEEEVEELVQWEVIFHYLMWVELVE
jgi:hypothetical protein